LRAPSLLIVFAACGGSYAPGAAELGSSPHALSSWAAGTPLPVGISGPSLAVGVKRLYSIGGVSRIIVSSGGAPTVETDSRIWTGEVASDGRIASWSPAGQACPYELPGPAVVLDGFLILLDGTRGSTLLPAQVARIGADGTLGPFVERGLTAALGPGVAVVGARIYGFGGQVGYVDVAGGVVSGWTALGPAPNGTLAAGVAAGRLYALGKENGTISLASAALLPDGSLGAWRAELVPSLRLWLAAAAFANSSFVATDGEQVSVGTIDGSGAVTWSSAPQLPTAWNADIAMAIVDGRFAYALGGFPEGGDGAQTVIPASPAVLYADLLGSPCVGFVCPPPDSCHRPGTCDPSIGICVYAESGACGPPGPRFGCTVGCGRHEAALLLPALVLFGTAPRRRRRRAPAFPKTG
jgi:hypothetical protein